MKLRDRRHSKRKSAKGVPLLGVYKEQSNLVGSNNVRERKVLKATNNPLIGLRGQVHGPCSPELATADVAALLLEWCRCYQWRLVSTAK